MYQLEDFPIPFDLQQIKEFSQNLQLQDLMSEENSTQNMGSQKISDLMNVEDLASFDSNPQVSTWENTTGYSSEQDKMIDEILVGQNNSIAEIKVTSEPKTLQAKQKDEKRLSKQKSLQKEKKIKKESQNKQKKVLQHLTGQRRKKGQKNKLQGLVGGYWTKNLLPLAKNHHFSYIQKCLGTDALRQLYQKYPHLVQIQKKHGITMEDYKALYCIEQLESVWKSFFRVKILYRELMISRTEKNYRLIYSGFLGKFQEAYKKKRFIGISRKVAEQDYSSQSNSTKYF